MRKRSGTRRHSCTRSFVFLLSILPLLTGPAHAQSASLETPSPEAFRVLPLSGAPAPQMTPLLLYQTSLAWQQDQLRQTRWSRVKTEADLLQLRAELRRSVLEMIGGLPVQKTALHPEITGTIRAKRFHIEKLLYQSLPGLYVTALVYVPDNGEKVHPAILVAAGHSQNGKIHYADLCQRLVQRGYLVISWDPIGQGERSQFWDAKTHRSRYNLICAEHAVIGNLAYLAGANLARWEVWDGVRAVDYLLTRHDVDANRINLTGTSGGGFQTALLGALDERIKVIIPSCYITALPMRVENRIFVDPDSDPEQDLAGFISKGVDHAGLLLLMYPRAVMVATATLDFFPIQGAHKSFGEVNSFYQRFGHADRIAFAETYNEHQYSLKNQEAALRFLDGFNGMPMRDGLPAVTAFPDADLQVTRSGQISVDYRDARPLVHFITEYADQARQNHHETLAELYRSDAPDIGSWKVIQYNGISYPQTLEWERLGTSNFRSLHIDRYLLHHSTYLQMPMLHIHDDRPGAKGAILWFSLQGHASEKDWPQIASLVHEGYEVYSFDFRGLGETRMKYRAISPDDPDLVKGDFEQAYMSPLSSVLGGYVYNSLLTGRPYFLQLVDDMQIAIHFIRSQQPNISLALAGSGEASTLASSFQRLNPAYKILPGTLSPAVDWAELVTEGKEDWSLAFLLPSGALLHWANCRVRTVTGELIPC